MGNSPVCLNHRRTSKEAGEVDRDQVREGLADHIEEIGLSPVVKSGH